MTATLTLFRPSILDPVEPTDRPLARRDADRTPVALRDGDGGQTKPREPGSAHDHTRSAPSDGEHPQLREPGYARDRDSRSHQPTVQRDGGPTLDDLLVGVWEGLAAHRTVACPACGEAMAPRYSAGPVPVGGRCHSCGTTIA